MQETWVRPLGWEDPLEEETATHASTLAWRIPWTEAEHAATALIPRAIFSSIHWQQSLLSVFHLRMSWFSPSVLKDIFTEYTISFSIWGKKYCATFFWPPWFQLRNLLLFHLFSPRYKISYPFKIFTQFTILLVLGGASYFVLKLGHFS